MTEPLKPKERKNSSTRQMAVRRRRSALWIALLGILSIALLGYLLQNANLLGLGGFGILVLLILLRTLPDLIERQVDRKFKTEKRALRGARAEEVVEALLAELDQDTLDVRHDIPTPYGNIDHLVIARHGGVFLLETKSHSGRVQVQDGQLLVNGKPPEKNFIAQALKSTYWLRDRIAEQLGLTVWITPVIVFTNAFVPGSKPLRGVRVINKRFLLKLLRTPTVGRATTGQLWQRRQELALF